MKWFLCLAIILIAISICNQPEVAAVRDAVVKMLHVLPWELLKIVFEVTMAVVSDTANVDEWVYEGKYAMRMLEKLVEMRNRKKLCESSSTVASF